MRQRKETGVRKTLSLADAVRVARGEMSQSQLAKLAGVNPAQISMLESGKREDIYFSTIAKIARILHISLDELAGSVFSDAEFDVPGDKLEHRIIELEAHKEYVKQHFSLQDQALDMIIEVLELSENPRVAARMRELSAHE